MAFRFYSYISDTKVDMLLSQIDPTFAGKRRTELTVKLSVLSAKRMVERPDTDRVGRLERVLRYLQDHGDIGTVDQPGQFFWGMLPVQWGTFPSNAHPSLLFAGGRDEDTVVALGGSGKHVIGTDQPADAWSQLPRLLDGLDAAEASELEDDLVVEAAEADALDGEDQAALATVFRSVERLRGPAQNVEFVAKRLLHGRSHGIRVVLGSPIYIAQVD